MPEAAEVSEGRGSGGTVITEQTSWPAAHGAGLAAASVLAGGARAASRWQSRARALQPARPRAAAAASRVEAGASAACGCHAFTFLTPGRAAADQWRYVSDAVLKTHRRGPRSLQKTYPKEASVVLASHRGTHCARRGV